MTRIPLTYLLKGTRRGRRKYRDFSFGEKGEINDLAKRYIAGVRRESRVLYKMAEEKIHRNMSFSDVVMALNDIRKQLDVINKYIRMTHNRL